jgi:hypothetical protein
MQAFPTLSASETQIGNVNDEGSADGAVYAADAVVVVAGIEP